MMNKFVTVILGFAIGLAVACEEDSCENVEADFADFLADNSSCEVDEDCKAVAITCYGGPQSACSVVGVRDGADDEAIAALDERLRSCSDCSGFEGECGSRTICRDSVCTAVFP